jgi:hypothetical protein
MLDLLCTTTPSLGSPLLPPMLYLPLSTQLPPKLASRYTAHSAGRFTFVALIPFVCHVLPIHCLQKFLTVGIPAKTACEYPNRHHHGEEAPRTGRQNPVLLLECFTLATASQTSPPRLNCPSDDFPAAAKLKAFCSVFCRFTSEKSSSSPKGSSSSQASSSSPNLQNHGRPSQSYYWHWQHSLPYRKHEVSTKVS